ncbi:hypothetical protein J2Z19_005608 [Ensifer adhaerens]|uniref:Uncharacterized protein n=1 Tax=Ensifer adhaerens TaxID=106592 RepID=A0ACC5T454_ENSAD|nr:hypothetical protein [Ensifer adhaerens]
MHINGKASSDPVLHGISSLAADIRWQPVLDDQSFIVGF